MLNRREVIAGAATVALSGLARADNRTTRIIGETVALSGTDSRSLLHPIRRLFGAYRFNEDGQRIDYTRFRDYMHIGDSIARTPNSAIYDFQNYKVARLPGGKFEWADNPRNPPKTLMHQVYVDYETDLIERTIPPLARFPVQGKLLIAGDSIAAGVDTIASFSRGSLDDSFGSLLQKHVEGIDVTYASKNGGDVWLFKKTLDIQMKVRPQIAIFEFGMNDHYNGFKNLEPFGTHLLDVVGQFQRIGAKTILVGFPQQNRGWTKEIPDATIAFNQSIENVARLTGSPFVDIFGAFQRLSTRKNIDLEVFGDGLHHPNTFGHKVYFSEIVPYLKSSPLRSTDLWPDFVSIPS